MLRLGVFASGRGSNFQSILAAIDSGRLDAEVRLLLSNNAEAGARQTAASRNIPAAVINRPDFPDRETFVEAMLEALKSRDVDFVALAGYMKKIPPEVIQSYPHRMVNIHPALLPAFGGRGMYGRRVHEAVLEAGCKVTGVTVHLVDEHYDHGPIVAQSAVSIADLSSADAVAARVLELEHRLYPETLQSFAEDRVSVAGSLVTVR